MEVAGTAGLGRGVLGHEGNGLAVWFGEFFDALFEDRSRSAISTGSA